MFDLALDGFAIQDDIDRESLLGLANHFGTPVPDWRVPDLIRDLRPVGTLSAPRHSLAGRYGLGPFPFHTETAYWRRPARFLMLYCVNPGSGDRGTFLCDSREAFLPEELGRMTKDLWVVSRIRKPFLATTAENTIAGTLFRYDAECMRPAHPRPSDMQEKISSRLADARHVPVEWTQRRLLVVDNHRMLHGRGPSLSADVDRHLLRILVQEKAC
jgi:alpha-ketoglutarate-dependent taurine dioxygenase